jgi:hypothetical protein
VTQEHINLYPFGGKKDGEERFEQYREAWVAETAFRVNRKYKPESREEK